MTGKAMSLKAKIKNLSRAKNMSAQVVLQNYMFDRFLIRLSQSPYRDNFILKGGMLIASIVGIGNRSTMDMDATIIDYPLDKGSLLSALIEICEIKMGDDVIFNCKKVESIREDNPYGGFRASLLAEYDSIVTPLQIDITTGDVITPCEILYSYRTMLDQNSINIWAYNIETVLAEKVETILSRGELSTRPRDYYDVYVLVKTQNFSIDTFQTALRKTSQHRNSELIHEDIEKRIKQIESSEVLEKRWGKYTKDYQYANEITYRRSDGSIKTPDEQ